MVDNGIHPLPPSGYSHLSQGESQLQNTAPANCPPETGGPRSVATEGVDSFVICTLKNSSFLTPRSLASCFHPSAIVRSCEWPSSEEMYC